MCRSPPPVTHPLTPYYTYYTYDILLATVCTSPRYHNKTTQSNVDPKAPIYIVTGAAGCDELHEPFTKQQPPRSAFRSNTFGYADESYHILFSAVKAKYMYTLRIEYFHHTET